eukprot:160556-Hanusia_phi.AAC.1
MFQVPPSCVDRRLVDILSDRDRRQLGVCCDSDPLCGREDRPIGEEWEAEKQAEEREQEQEQEQEHTEG